MGSQTIMRKDSNDIRQVLDAIRNLVRSLRVSEREAERTYGLTAAQLFVLQKLQEAPSISLNELAERTATDQSSVSVVVARLVSRELVSRERSESDARRLQLRLSRRGAALMRHKSSTFQEKLIASIGELSAKEQRELAALLERVVDGIGVPRRKSPPMFFEDHHEKKMKRR